MLCLASHRFRLAVAIARGEVQQVDPGRNGGVDGRDAFLDRGLTPKHAQTATAQCQGGDGEQGTECVA